MPLSRPHAGASRRRSEAAFTLIELMVTCVLLLIVLGIMGTIVLQSITGSRDASASARAKTNAADAAERFGSDIRAARAFGRDGSTLIDPISLADAIEHDKDLFDHAGQKIDWRDIVVATGSRLVLQADVVDEAVARPECIEWNVVGSGTWHVHRTVRAYTPECAGGGGSVFEDDQVTTPTDARPAPGTSGTPALFSYAVSSVVAAGGCRTTEMSTPSPIQRNRIVGARINFTSIDEDGDQSALTSSHEVIALRSRSGTDYQTAMECDE